MEKKNNNKKQERDYLLSLKKALFIGTLGVTTAISSACGNTKKISQENPFPNGESSIFLADNYDIDGLKFEGYEEAVFISKDGNKESYSELLERCKTNINEENGYGLNKSLYKIGRVILQKRVAEALGINISDMESFSVEYLNDSMGEENPYFVTVGYQGKEYVLELEGEIGREIAWCISKTVTNSIPVDEDAYTYTDINRVIRSYKDCLNSDEDYVVDNGEVKNSSIEKVGDISFEIVKNKTKKKN